MLKSLGVFVLSAAAFCTIGCSKDKAPDVSTTHITSAEVQPPADDYVSMVKREQATLRGRVDDQLRTIEQAQAELRNAANADPNKIHELNSEHAVLESDLRALNRADERGWDELKAVIQHDLEGDSDQP
jgi:hypothetical protein